MRIAIIGGAAAGPAVAAEARRQNPAAEIVLFEEGERISSGLCEIPYYVSGEIEDIEALEVFTPREFEREKGATVRTRHRVVSLDARRRRLVADALDFGSRHEEAFDRFVITTGARSRRLGVEGEDAPNVFAVRTLADGERLRSYLESEPVRHVVVVGAGYIGVEMADELRKRGLRVTVLDRAGRALARTLSEGMCGQVGEAMRRHGVALRQEVPTRLRLDGAGRVTAIETDRGERIGCQAVVVAIGVVPETALAEAAGVKLGKTGALAVDDGMQTNVAHVWACGDCVELPRQPDGKKIHLPLATVARRGARVAARNAAREGRGGRATFAPTAGPVGVCAFGVQAARTGIHLDEALEAGYDAVAVQISGYNKPPSQPTAAPLHVRLIVERGSGRVLGGETSGAPGAALRVDVIAAWIVGKWTARQIVDELDLLYSPPIAPAVDPLLRAAHRAARAAAEGTRRR